MAWVLMEIFQGSRRDISFAMGPARFLPRSDIFLMSLSATRVLGYVHVVRCIVQSSCSYTSVHPYCFVSDVQTRTASLSLPLLLRLYRGEATAKNERTFYPREVSDWAGGFMLKGSAVDETGKVFHLDDLYHSARTCVPYTSRSTPDGGRSLQSMCWKRVPCSIRGNRRPAVYDGLHGKGVPDHDLNTVLSSKFASIP